MAGIYIEAKRGTRQARSFFKFRQHCIVNETINNDLYDNFLILMHLLAL